MMKQNFQRHYYNGENENAIRTQVWCTLITQLLLTILQKNPLTEKVFFTKATMVRIHLISMLNLFELLRNSQRGHLKKEYNLSQISLFFT